MGCPSLAQISCQSEEISQSKSRAEHYWLEAYPTVVVGRYLYCEIGVLPEDLSLAMDVIP